MPSPPPPPWAVSSSAAATGATHPTATNAVLHSADGMVAAWPGWRWRRRLAELAMLDTILFVSCRDQPAGLRSQSKHNTVRRVGSTQPIYLLGLVMPVPSQQYRVSDRQQTRSIWTYLIPSPPRLICPSVTVRCPTVDYLRCIFVITVFHLKELGAQLCAWMGQNTQNCNVQSCNCVVTHSWTSMELSALDLQSETNKNVVNSGSQYIICCTAQSANQFTNKTCIHAR